MALLSFLHVKYIRLIGSIIWLNEKIFFYPKLNAFYQRQLINKRPLIFDVGANKGQSIQFFKKLFPECTIHAFEPNPKIFKGLTEKYASNEVYCHQKAVSETSGKSIFYESILDETSSLEKADETSDYMKLKSRIFFTSTKNFISAAYEVEVMTLDDFIKSENVQSIDLVKVDVEGHELSVLRGLKHTLANQHIKFLQLEEHQSDQYSKNANLCKQFLATAGYKEVLRIKHGFGNFYEVIYERSDLNPAH